MQLVSVRLLRGMLDHTGARLEAGTVIAVHELKGAHLIEFGLAAAVARNAEGIQPNVGSLHQPLSLRVLTEKKKEKA